MSDSNSTIYSENGKRRILIVDDEAINREILGIILQGDYEPVFACDGLEAMNTLKEQKDFVSLVILDLIMPNMSGQEVLRQIRSNDEYQDIPVIVASGDETQEIECLNAGASDFIQKPYPEPGIILARVRRTIEFFETRHTLHTTERDPLTGLYNREFFYSYAEQYDHHHPYTMTDAIVIDINHFASINERYGRAYADGVLKKVGARVRDIVHDSGGIVCRRESDIFLVYCPHREDYKALLEKVSRDLEDEQSGTNRVRLRMGVYSNTDRTLEMERRFDRAKMASDTVRNNYTRNIAIYDDTLLKAELYSEKLVDDFNTAIEEKQFKVFYQPKFDITSDVPKLCGAEALVRWQHPELGMISPGVFIPLFEHNGLIQALDHYVWSEAARQTGEWKERLGFSVPVSINVSRVNMHDPNIVYTLLDILEKGRIGAESLHLEVTETVYAEDAEKMIETVKRLRSVGFLIEMDDFGSGYSSLNMLSTLDIDVLKMDMKFVQTAFSRNKDTHMLEIIVEIADHLCAPVIAEGVETEEQLNTLKELGCEIVQGYYFSPPVPAADFEHFLTEAKETEEAAADSASRAKEKAARSDKKKENFLKSWSRRLNLSMKKAEIFFVTIAFAAVAALLISDAALTSTYQEAERVVERNITARQSAEDLEKGSDYLTEKARAFAVTGDPEYMKDYFEEVSVTRRRDGAVKNLETLLGGNEDSAYSHLSEALALSNELMELEYRAFMYRITADGIDSSDVPEELKGFSLSSDELLMTPEEMRAEAVELVYGDEYRQYKELISESANLCTEELINESNKERTDISAALGGLFLLQTILIFVMLAVVLCIVVFMIVWIGKPLRQMVESMRAHETVPPSGAEELRYVSETYNYIFDENRRTHERLTFDNMHDSLTGVYNRSAYDFIKNDIDMSQNAILVVDIDKFKSINDNYGHDTGDRALKRVAEVLKYNFRSTDLIFRLGGDEFVIIVTNVSGNSRDAISEKIDQANIMLQNPHEDLPPVSISAGAAFADRSNPQGNMLKDADSALYRMKEAGRGGCEFY